MHKWILKSAPVLDRVSIAGIKHHNQNQQGEDKYDFTLHF